MAKFHVVAREVSYLGYEVEAATAEEARRMVEEGAIDHYGVSDDSQDQSQWEIVRVDREKEQVTAPLLCP